MSSATGLRLFYALIFLGTGASLPYLPVWLRAQGLEGAAIGAILAAPQLARVVTGQLAARWADGFRQRRTALMGLAALAAVAFASLLATREPLGWAAAWFVGSTAAMVMIPLTDVLALRLARREGFVYGRLRAMGSLAFIAANLVVGALITRGSPTVVILWMVAAAAAAALSVRLLLPPEPVHEDAPPARPAGLRLLAGNRRFLLAISAAGLLQAAHAYHYGFSALVWKGQGLSETVTGALWATGVGAEVLFLWFLEGWRERVGPERLLLLAGAASVLRWTISALAPPVEVLFPLQLLHALTFAAAFLASLQLVHRLAPAGSASAAQTLAASLSSGLFIGLATLGSGPLFDAFGAGGYLAMTAMSGAGLLGALALRRQLSSPSPASSSR